MKTYQITMTYQILAKDEIDAEIKAAKTTSYGVEAMKQTVTISELGDVKEVKK